MENPTTDRSQPVGSLLYAATAGKLERIASLLDEGVDVNAVGAKEMTALHWAARFGKLKSVQMLLERGAAVNMKTVVGMTPLMDAVCMGQSDVVTVLLAAGAEIDHRVADVPELHWRAGKTALGLALHSEYLCKNEGERGRIIASLAQGGGDE